jgi:dihydrolipoamide dehydrogenase
MYDLTIIGCGWAGFNAALKAKELGLKVCLVEKAQIGGTCLNSGCIPTKALIQSAKAYALSKKSENFGIRLNTPHPDFKQIQERKEKIITQLRSAMQSMLAGIDFRNAEARILSREEIKAGDESIKTRFILIAAGSRPVELSTLKFDAKRILSSNEILNLKEIPESLLIVGGGVIGCEFASLFSILGSQVTIAEKMPQLLPGEDREVARKIETLFKKKGIKVNTNTSAEALNSGDYRLILVCVGRAPKTEGLGLEEIGVELERGRVSVDEYLKTNLENIYAAGDCTGKTMLAHFAAYQGIVAAENMAHPDKPRKADNANIPNCVFTDPEIASVGISEDAAKDKGIDINIHKFDFLGLGMARIADETEGFLKIVSDKNTGVILGASIIGPRATELIATLTLAASNRLKISQLKDTIFSHPTFSEAIGEALK